MTAYQIQTLTRRCSVSGRALQPGEKYFSTLLEENGRFVRKDYAAEAWAGPPEGVIGFWAGRVPTGGEPKRLAINDDLLADCFAHLDGAADADRQNFRYVVALLLMRRKRFRFEETTRDDGRDVLVLRDARTGTRHRVIDPRLSAQAMTDVQDEVFRVLGWE
jgi:hypothetical protein